MRARSIRFVRSKKKFIETCVDLRRFWRAPNENARKRIERYTHDRLKNVLTPNVAVLNGQKRYQCKRVVFRDVVPKPCCRSIHGNMRYTSTPQMQRILIYRFVFFCFSRIRQQTKTHCFPWRYSPHARFQKYVVDWYRKRSDENLWSCNATDEKCLQFIFRYLFSRMGSQKI